jgi:hypothetical protein
MADLRRFDEPIPLPSPALHELLDRRLDAAGPDNCAVHLPATP